MIEAGCLGLGVPGSIVFVDSSDVDAQMIHGDRGSLNEHIVCRLVESMTIVFIAAVDCKDAKIE